MSVEFRWYGEEITEKVRSAVQARLTRAASSCVNYAKVNMSDPAETELARFGRSLATTVRGSREAGTRMRFRYKKIKGQITRGSAYKFSRAWEDDLYSVSSPRQRRRVSGGKLVRINASTIDQFPKRRTGQLRRSLAYTFPIADKGMSVIWGTNVPYGKWLEFGTRRMAPRPWMTLTNRACESEVKRLLGGDVGVDIIEI